MSVCCSYLAEQCWNGGFIYLIMLRRFKHKAHLTYNGNSGNSSEPAETPTLELGDQTSKKGKRTRKFGVISRPPINKAPEESKSSSGCDVTDDSNHELENGTEPDLGNGHAFELENGPHSLKDVAGPHLEKSEVDTGAELKVPKTEAPLGNCNDKRRFSKTGKTDFQSSDCLARVRCRRIIKSDLFFFFQCTCVCVCVPACVSACMSACLSVGMWVHVCRGLIPQVPSTLCFKRSLSPT